MSRLADTSIAFCESQLAEHGDTAQGVGWPRGDAELRYRAMLDVIRPSSAPVSLLDFGCGASHLYEHIRARRLPGIVYSGLDLSPRFLDLSRRKFPEIAYHAIDVLDPRAAPLPAFDYIVMNGIFTYRGPHSYDETFDYLRDLVRAVFVSATHGLAFNVMSKQVEWEREDLFHLPVDPLLTFLSREVSRHLVVRHDYGLYEYTVYVYRTPSGDGHTGVKRLLAP